MVKRQTVRFWNEEKDDTICFYQQMSKRYYGGLQGDANSSWPTASRRAGAGRFYQDLILQGKGRRQSRYQYRYYLDGVGVVCGWQYWKEDRHWTGKVYFWVWFYLRSLRFYQQICYVFSRHCYQWRNTDRCDSHVVWAANGLRYDSQWEWWGIS